MRTSPTLEFENKLWSEGINLVAGIDEVGRGSWAGPLVAAAVIFDKVEAFNLFTKTDLKYVNDSKLLTPDVRVELAKLIKEKCIAFAIGEIGLQRINNYGIGKCSQYAYRKSIKLLKLAPDHILIDAFKIKYLDGSKQTPIIKGDTKSYTIAAASIIAKVYRDNIMTKLDRQFPEYNLEQNMGYGTKSHREAISVHGLSTVHRSSFNLNKYSTIKL